MPHVLATSIAFVILLTLPPLAASQLETSLLPQLSTYHRLGPEAERQHFESALRDARRRITEGAMPPSIYETPSKGERAPHSPGQGLSSYASLASAAQVANWLAALQVQDWMAKTGNWRPFDG